MLFRFGLPATKASASSLPATVARMLRGAVSCGTLTVADRQRVNGTEAIELTSRSGSLIPETIWVSPGTYLPVRVVVGPGPGKRGFQQTANIAWLPPTAQNLNLLTVPVPAGFRKVTLPQAVTPILGLPPFRPLVPSRPGLPVPFPAAPGLRPLAPFFR
jgi:hypothetical protein